ncbi:MAG: 3-oxoacyl-[acyl-carrier protein] reductase, partial [Mucilaginibacter sp.]|nr:3-oxoacyl-[acyl-carrier protein] reductase [Mucilaginibacter sp.]
TALITGASAGIGYETAKVLSEEGAQTIIVARRQALLDEIADEIASKGALRPLVIVDDASSNGASLRVRDQVIAQYGHLDILINNLGQARPFGLSNPDSDWDEAFNLNFTTARKFTEAFLDGMVARKFGRIVCLTATSEPFGMSGSLTSKAALLIWAKGLSRMVAKEDVTVNCISPGILVTDQIRNDFIPRVLPTADDEKRFLSHDVPAGHFGEPSDAAHLIAFLCSPKAGYITGQRVYVDGGWNRHV